MLIAAQALHLHWKAYRKAVAADEPLPFTWVAIGYRIMRTGTWLRECYGYEDGKPAYQLLALAGTMYYGGKRGKR